MTKRSFILIVGLIAISSLMSACPKSRADIEKEMEKVPLSVNLPEAIVKTEDDPALAGDASKFITVEYNGIVSIGRAAYPSEQLQEAIEKRIGTVAGKPVYLQGDYSVGYGKIVEALTALRDAGGSDVALVVHGTSGNAPRRFSVIISPKPTETQAPAAFEVSLGADGKLGLKDKSMGTLDQPEALIAALKAGSAKDVTIRSIKKARYGDVVKVADAVKGATGGKITLMIDDLL